MTPRFALEIFALIGAAVGTWLGFLVAGGSGAFYGCVVGSIWGMVLASVALGCPPARIWALIAALCAIYAFLAWRCW